MICQRALFSSSPSLVRLVLRVETHSLRAVERHLDGVAEQRGQVLHASVARALLAVPGGWR